MKDQAELRTKIHSPPPVNDVALPSASTKPHQTRFLPLTASHVPPFHLFTLTFDHPLLPSEHCCRLFSPLSGVFSPPTVVASISAQPVAIDHRRCRRRCRYMHPSTPHPPSPHQPPSHLLVPCDQASKRVSARRRPYDLRLTSKKPNYQSNPHITLAPPNVSPGNYKNPGGSSVLPPCNAVRIISECSSRDHHS